MKKRDILYNRQRKKPEDPRLMGALCDKCPLRGRDPVYGDGPPTADIAIVMDQPSKEEALIGIPFVSRGGEYVENLLNRAGFSRHAVLLDYAIACFPPDGDLKSYLTIRRREAAAKWKADGKKGKPTPEMSPVACCRPRLMRSLGVPQCNRCMKWKLSIEDHPEKCTCKPPHSWLRAERPEVGAVLAAGNLALESLTGHPGVQAKQMYVFGVKR